RDPHLLGEVGIVHRRGRVGPDIQDVVAVLPQHRGDVLLQIEAGVIRSDDDLHTVTPVMTDFAAATTASAPKPNFFCSSLSGADAPNVAMPMILPPEPT